MSFPGAQGGFVGDPTSLARDNMFPMDRLGDLWLYHFFYKQALIAPYRINDPRHLGVAVVINNVASQYPGSRKDTNGLVEAYKKMKFEVHLFEDCDDMVNI